ncbi:protein ref(2)P-like [Anopheles ziemanni]|uniref:protein ref(2)P-like n=1 Tax=Anopheles coustani TaxID=139045 RepID=UPI002658320B|nr:protein ref(2)P-like [Anopheles coustani]XP_058177180.1 protein ref(2)P-like [Anopheles ziemanni]
MRSLKIIIRVGTLQNIFLLHGEEVCKTINEVKQFCFSRFPHLEHDKNLRMFWIDQDFDEICVVTDGDYSSFMLAEETEKGRLYVEGNEMTERDASHPQVQSASAPDVYGSRPQHTNVVCDVCDQMIVGHRYRCLMCHDYDLCMTCESKYRHKDHIMLRIPRATDSRQMHSVFEKMEFYAGLLKLEEENPSQVPLVDDGVSGTPPTAEKSEERTNPQGNGHRRQPTFCQRMGRGNFAAMRTANAAASAMAQDRAQARFREVLSRYIDPANISGPAASSADAAPSPSTTAHEEVLTEAQRSLKIASDAAKVASAAATASWNTFMGCAGMFVPPGTQNTTPKQPSPTATNAATPSSSNGSVVAGLVDDVLKHTPPELKEFMPSEDEINRLSEKLSNMLSSLGIEFTGESSTSSSSAKKEAEQNASDKEKDSLSSSMNSGKEQKQEKVAANKPSVVSSEAKQPLLETDHVVASSSHDDGKLTEEEKGQITENIDCSVDTSSASMLTDDDDDVVDAVQVSEQNASPQASSSQPKAPWILVDLPDDREEEVKQTVINTTSSVPVASGTPASSPEKVDDKQTPEETSPKEQPEEEEFYANTFKTMIDLIKQLTVDPSGAEQKVSEMIERSQTEKNKHAQDDRYKAHLEKAAKELQKHLLEVKMKEQNERQTEAPVLQQSAKDKKSAPQASTTARAFSPATPLPSTSAPKTPNASSKIYSPRPHVNQAIHTMMTMGFSNNDGHLTRLLEALNGDIQRALDMLMQNLS